jgi:hypothetical protein
MLREQDSVGQTQGEGARRRFIDDDLELILWYDLSNKLEGFQILYNKSAGTRTITWKKVKPVDGELKSVLVSDGPYNSVRIQNLVEKSSENLETNLRRFILERLQIHGG